MARKQAHSAKDRSDDAAKSHRWDVHQQVTDKIIKAIEAGAGDWKMPWHRPGSLFDVPKNVLTNKHYRGINILSLWIDADEKKFDHQTWATFKQWQELNAQVKKGEKGSLIVKYGEWSPKELKEAAKDGSEPGTLLYAKPAWVFNIAQVDGYPLPEAAPSRDLTIRLADVDRFIDETKAQFRYGGQRAYYRHRKEGSTEGDFIQIPERSLFIGTAQSSPTESFEATRLHELLHWTGAKHRLDRQHGKRFGDDTYAFEELVAELGAAALCAHLEISSEPRADHAQYIEHWLKVLKADKKAIFTAASASSKAVEYLFSLQPARPEAKAEELMTEETT